MTNNALQIKWYSCTIVSN